MIKTEKKFAITRTRIIIASYKAFLSISEYSMKDPIIPSVLCNKEYPSTPLCSNFNARLTWAGKSDM